MNNGAESLKRELLIRLVCAFDAGILEAELDRIPIKLRPQGIQSSRCCIYHDRAVIKYRLMALLGFLCEDENDESKTLAEYYRDVLDGKRKPLKEEAISVCTAGCSACPDSRLVVTGNCRGCFARPCTYSCPRGAITVVEQVSQIDYSKCIKCGKCMEVCPFRAIVRTTVPCEEACPVGAIRKEESGHTRIDFDKCIYCGKCLSKCPFSAVMERSQMLDVLLALRNREKLVAMIAPSAQDQFPGTVEQLFSAVSQLGFFDVMEVAIGAELTARNEAAEFRKRISAGEKLMTTSCCPAYIELVRKHLPSFLSHVSSTPSPMQYADRLAKEKWSDAKTVFFGPCIAKCVEAKRDGIDFVLSFKELEALLFGRRIDVVTCNPLELPHPAFAPARNFSHSCGVTEAVLQENAGSEAEFKLNAKFINGIDKKTVSMLKLYDSGKLPANFLEAMACEGGCVNGPVSLAKK